MGWWLLLVMGCAPEFGDQAVPGSAAEPPGGDPPESDGGAVEPPPELVDKAEEQVPGSGWPTPSGGPGDALYAEGVIHDFDFELSPATLTSLQQRPTEWAEADLTFDGTTMTVGVRLKGASTWQPLSGEPSFKLDVNRYVDDQRIDGIPSFYMHAMMYDPSRMHEHLAYEALRGMGIPAPRTGYARLKLNDQDYGLYVLVEKINGPFLDRWFDDDSGAVYEGGSEYYGCDVNVRQGGVSCGCLGLDREGEVDGRDALTAMCQAATSQGDDWTATLDEHLEWQPFLDSLAGDMIIAHWDDYAFNLNNFRIIHVPDRERFYWTSWSADLAWGWYPWMNGASCGTYGVQPRRFQEGYLAKRCWSDAGCTEQLNATLVSHADRFEALGLHDHALEVAELVASDVALDPRTTYNVAAFEEEVDCLVRFIGDRPDQIRGMAGDE